MNNTKINNEDITFVVQEPVQATNGRDRISGIAQDCLKSIRKFLLGSKIVISIWKNQQLQRLGYDVLLELDDPR